MRLSASIHDERRKISTASSYIAFLGLAGAEITSARNYDEIRDAQGNLYLRTRAQLRRDNEFIHTYIPPAKEIPSIEDHT
jgi:hypothetical protein